MKRLLHNLQVGTRRTVLAGVLMVPDSWRAALSRNALLTRCYEFFDRSRYDAIYDAGAWDEKFVDEDVAGRSLPMGEYTYFPPRLTAAIRHDIEASAGPLISVIMPVYNTDAAWLTKAIDSVRSQWYPNWELCIADDHSDRPETLAVLGRIDDPRIHVHHLPDNRNIAGASNVALEMASGEYVALLDHDDELTPDALYQAWKAIAEQGADFIYSDEDKLDEQGVPCEPHFKPDFSPEQFLSQNYLCHLAVIRKSLVDRVGGFSTGFDGAQDYDLFLKVLEHARQIVHLPRVLYHWRKVPGSTAARFSEKSYAQDAGRRALQAAMQRRGVAATAEDGRYPGTYRVRYAIEGAPRVSIVIPFRDEPALLETCITAIIDKSTWANYEIVGVSNNSEKAETFEMMADLSRRDDRVRFVRHDVPFNFSAINNFAVAHHARGEHVVLLNNDVEIITPDWLESLLEFSQRPDVGVVGGKLYYPDGQVQHAGIILGIGGRRAGGVAGHSHKHFPKDDPGYKSRPHIVQNLSALTGACFMVSKRIYEEVGGLDESRFRVAFNDVDFCLRVREKGYLNVFTPWCEAWHHESWSRGYEDTPEKKQRFDQEFQAFMTRHAAQLAAGDPYYNPNLTLWREDFSLSRDAQLARQSESH